MRNLEHHAAGFAVSLLGSEVSRRHIHLVIIYNWISSAASAGLWQGCRHRQGPRVQCGVALANLADIWHDARHIMHSRHTTNTATCTWCCATREWSWRTDTAKFVKVTRCLCSGRSVLLMTLEALIQHWYIQLPFSFLFRLRSLTVQSWSSAWTRFQVRCHWEVCQCIMASEEGWTGYTKLLLTGRYSLCFIRVWASD